MSYVTNVLVLASFTPREIGTKLTEGYHDGTRTVSFKNLGEDAAADHWAGSKFPEADVWAGAFNYLDPEQCLSWLREIWDDEPENVIVAICEQESDRWKIESLSPAIP